MAGGAGIAGNIYSGSVYANQYFYANGLPFVTGSTITVSNTAPSGSSIGALWFNSDSGEFFVNYNDGDSVQWVAPLGGQGPMGATGPQFQIPISDNPPASPSQGSLWWASNIGTLFFYYNDGDSSQWVNAIGGGGGAGGSGATGATGIGTTGATGATGPMVSRSTVSAVTASLANAASGNVDVTGFKSYALYKIQTSAACWVRIYTDTASRAADSARTETTDPGASSGVVAEVIATGANTIVIAPAAIGFNNESTPTTTIPCAVTNKSGSTQAITVTLTLLQLEL